MHSLGEMPVNIGIRVFQPSHLFYVHVLGLGVNSNMMPGMLACSLLDRPLHCSFRSDSALTMLTIFMYSINSLTVRYFNWNVSGFVSSFIYRAYDSTYDSTSCIIVVLETRLSYRSVIIPSTKGTLSLEKYNFVLNT